MVFPMSQCCNKSESSKSVHETIVLWGYLDVFKEKHLLSGNEGKVAVNGHIKVGDMHR